MVHSSEERRHYRRIVGYPEYQFEPQSLVSPLGRSRGLTTSSTAEEVMDGLSAGVLNMASGRGTIDGGGY